MSKEINEKDKQIELLKRDIQNLKQENTIIRSNNTIQQNLIDSSLTSSCFSFGSYSQTSINLILKRICINFKIEKNIIKNIKFLNFEM